MPRNPSELERLEQELAFYKKELSLYEAKATKEMLLANIRKIERQLGLESKPYNGG